MSSPRTTSGSRDWKALHGRMRDWARGLADETAQASLSYSDSRGARHEQPLWEVVFHIVNHGSHHRGQVSGFLRAMGHTPPSLDVIRFYREIRAALR